MNTKIDVRGIGIDSHTSIVPVFFSFVNNARLFGCSLVVAFYLIAEETQAQGSHVVICVPGIGSQPAELTPIQPTIIPEEELAQL